MKGAILAAVVWVKVLGQGPPLLDPGIGSLIGNIGIVGILVWHLWYHTTHSYPKMLERFSEEVERVRQQAAADLAAVRDTFHAEQHETRTMLIQTLQAMRTAVHDVRDVAGATIHKVAAAAEQQRQERERGPS